MLRTLGFLLIGAVFAALLVSCGSGGATAEGPAYVSAFLPAEITPTTGQFMVVGSDLGPAGAVIHVRCTCATSTPFAGGTSATFDLQGAVRFGGGAAVGPVPDRGLPPHCAAFSTTAVVRYADGTIIPSPELIIRFGEVPNVPCIDRPEQYTTPASTPLSVPAATGVLANSYDMDGDVITSSIYAQPAHGTVVLQPDGSFVYTPHTGYSGIDTFAYTADDGYGPSSPILVTLYVGSGTWLPQPQMPVGRAAFVAGAIDGVLYVAGGITPTGDTGSCDAYVDATGLWQGRAPMLSPRRHAASAVVGRKLYVFGGLAPAGSHTAEVYDPDLDTWTLLAPMPVPRHLHAAAAVDGKVYLFGGTAPDPARVDIYDVALDAWTTATNAFPTGRHYVSAQALDGLIYVMGGGTFTEVDWFDVYDPAADSWTALAPLPTPVGPCTSGVVRGRIHVAGGWDGGPHGTHLIYDPYTSAWTVGPPMLTPRNTPAGAVIDNRFFVLGGGDPTGARIPDVEAIWYAPSWP